MMGDPKKKEGPGNQWRNAPGWPVNATPTSYFLRASGALTTGAPVEKTGSQSFDYNPLSPVPSIQLRDKDWLNRAPLDQRSLNERPDILRFRTMPLNDPVSIAGEIRAEIFVSTTAKDTDFFVRLLDIYPDGFEALMAAQPMRLRFREGFERMMPAVPGRVYKLTIPLWSQAFVFGKGHRIGVQITSSDSPRFDRHSNTWEPVKSYGEGVIATNTVFYSSGKASRVILPVVR